MAERCQWPHYCSQDRSDESGEYCYYHLKLVLGQVSPAPVSKRKPLEVDLERAGADPDVYEGVDEVERKVPQDRSRKAKLLQGHVRYRRPRS
jgi:hypothetical protein